MSPEREERPVWGRCWCYRIGRCLVDCPTADHPHPNPMTDENWRRAYDDVLAGRTARGLPVTPATPVPHEGDD